MLGVYISSLKRKSGKSLIAGGFLGTMQSLSYRTGYYKPIMMGANSTNNDIDFINKIDKNIITISSYKFQNTTQPLIGAYESGIKKIDTPSLIMDYRRISNNSEFSIVEGCNSIASPIDEKTTEISLIKQFGLPLILVVDPTINTLDEVIQGINYIYTNRTKLMGIIINNYNKDSDNMEHKYFPQLIKEFTSVKIIGEFRHYDNFENLQPETLIGDTLNRFNLEEIFGLRIAKLVR